MLKFIVNIAKFIPVLITLASLSFGIMFFSLKGIIFALLCIACNLINFFFKNYIFKPLYYSMGRSSLPLLGQGERPHDHPRLDMLENYHSESISFGMPSGHAQSILFYATFWIIYVLMEFKDRKSNADIIYKCCSILYLMILVMIVIHNRYYFKYHTIEQIVIGGLFGIGLAFLAMFVCRTVFLTDYAKDCNKEDFEDETIDEIAENSTPVKDGQVQDARLQPGHQGQDATDTERNMQLMSYDFHNEQVNDYVNNFDESGQYNTPSFNKINQVGGRAQGYNDELSRKSNERFVSDTMLNRPY